MAPGGVFLAAKQDDFVILNLLLQPVDPIEERPGSLDKRIVYPSLCIVELLPFRPSAQLPTEEQVSDPFARQGRFDVSGVEVRRVPGVRA